MTLAFAVTLAVVVRCRGRGAVAETAEGGGEGRLKGGETRRRIGSGTLSGSDPSLWIGFDSFEWTWILKNLRDTDQ